ncbi:hypothetical protein EVAR_11270_1 [Eumeta japonica]|uniref:Histone-lysine N-methyltransferase SETMAR n=1 Tax=Eumeta variegata TaxID=151549 RepID=A0A4C1UKT5_EUMVA|nr:hypothetical protein EVAR_11270_1 [Eumeta japonica]
MRVEQEVEEKRPKPIDGRGVIFHHDSAKPYKYLATQQILREFGWEVLMHPQDSPDLAPSDILTCFDTYNSYASRVAVIRLFSGVSGRRRLPAPHTTPAAALWAYELTEVDSEVVTYRGRNPCAKGSVTKSFKWSHEVSEQSERHSGRAGGRRQGAPRSLIADKLGDGGARHDAGRKGSRLASNLSDSVAPARPNRKTYERSLPKNGRISLRRAPARRRHLGFDTRQCYLLLMDRIAC